MSGADAGMPRLPAAFAGLERYVDSWGRPTTGGRLAARCESTMAQICEFYEAMTARAEEALAHLDQYPLDALPPPETHLMALVLGLAQAHVAVEIHGQPRAPGTPWPHGIAIVRGLPLLG